MSLTLLAILIRIQAMIVREEKMSTLVVSFSLLFWWAGPSAQ
jgi:hypothetical protein